MTANQKSVAEVEGFIMMLRAACEDETMNETLQSLLSLPDKKRHEVVLKLVQELNNKDAPKILIEAISCLTDNAVAEKAYDAIYQCSR